MPIKNSRRQYGSITKVLHWCIALVFAIQYYLVYWKHYVLPENSELGGFYIRQLHKPIGVIALLLALFVLAWKQFNTKPEYIGISSPWQKLAAYIVHMLLYASILIMPLSGLLMSTASGYPINLFGLYELPLFLEKSKPLAKTCYTIHVYVSYLTIGLVATHIGAALKHHFVDKNQVLMRMIPFK